MTAVIIIIAIIILPISLLRFGIVIEYSDAGIKAWARVGFLSFIIYPEKEHRLHKIRKMRKKASYQIKPGSLNELLDIIPPIKEMLSRLKRKLLIKRLKINYIAANKDPYKTAMTYGSANAATSIIVPLLEEKFRIKKRDIKISADFESEELKIYVNIAISMAVWESIYVITALLPILKASLPERPERPANMNSNHRKEVRENG